jgi:uncharacterized delta-60 repeat protein
MSFILPQTVLRKKENQVMFKNSYRLGVGLMTLFLFGLGLPAAFAQVVVLPTAGVGWGAMSVALDPETDDVMVAGTGVSNWGEFVASSVSYSGTVNKVFGGGLVTTQVSKPSYPECWTYASAVQSDGKFLSGGFYAYARGTGFALVRYDTNGALDTTFNKTGIVTTNFSSNNAEIRAMVLQGSGSTEKIVASGQAMDNTNTIITARYTSSGVLDSTFGTGGTITDTIPTINGENVEDLLVHTVALQSDGSIVVGALFSPTSGPQSMALIRYALINSKWQRDTTFGIKGIATISIAGQSSNPNDIVVDADDNIVVAGDSDGDLAVVRFTAEGELDTTFGTGGFITESFASTASAVALDSEGNIVVSGVASNGNLLVARFTSTGALDTTFGSSGGVFNGQGYADDFPYSPYQIAHSVLIQSNGQIVAVGENSDQVNVVVRYNSNGTPDKTF